MAEWGNTDVWACGPLMKVLAFAILPTGCPWQHFWEKWQAAETLSSGWSAREGRQGKSSTLVLWLWPNKEKIDDSRRWDFQNSCYQLTWVTQVTLCGSLGTEVPKHTCNYCSSSKQPNVDLRDCHWKRWSASLGASWSPLSTALSKMLQKVFFVSLQEHYRSVAKQTVALIFFLKSQ